MKIEADIATVIFSTGDIPSAIANISNQILIFNYIEFFLIVRIKIFFAMIFNYSKYNKKIKLLILFIISIILLYKSTYLYGLLQNIQ